MSRLTLWLLRHGKPLVAPGTCYGRLDVAAEEAHTQRAARALWAEWRGAGHVVPGTAWCSPLKRAVQMASALQVLGLATPVACKSELAEMDFGAWEGQTWNDIGEPQLTQWTDDFWHHRAGGGESVDQFVKRVQHALTEALSLAGQPEPSTPGASAHVLWITHAGVIRAVRALLHQQDQFPLRANQWPTHAPEPGAWQVIELG